MKYKNVFKIIICCFLITNSYVVFGGNGEENNIGNSKESTFIGISQETNFDEENNTREANNVREANNNYEINDDKAKIKNYNDNLLKHQDMSKVKKILYKKKYWISQLGDSKRILMDEDNIIKYSKEIPETKGTNCTNLDKYSKMLSRDELLSEIRKYKKPEEKRYIGESELGENYYDELFKNRNEEAVKDINEIRYGVIVKNTQVRTFPTADVSYNEPNDIEFDLNCETVLKVGERVLILHSSKDEKFYLVKAYNYDGWVRKEDVAIAKDKNEWKEYGSQKEFLIITGDAFNLDVNLYNKNISGLKLIMGTKLPLAKDKPALLDNVSTESSYVVKLPVRDDNGFLKVVDGRIPMGRDVNEGYLKYNQKNIIKQSFKLLGNLYGWSDLYDTRDCSSFAADIYKTFGFDLPRNSSKQASVKNIVDVSKMNIEEKKEYIMSQRAGTLLYMPGHVMMYLGNYNNEPYIIHAAYSSRNQNKEVIKYNSVVITDLNIMRRNGKTFLESINFINNFENNIKDIED